MSILIAKNGHLFSKALESPIYITADTDYFNSIQDILNSYFIVLNELYDVEFDLEKYIANSKINPGISFGEFDVEYTVKAYEKNISNPLEKKVQILSSELHESVNILFSNSKKYIVEDKTNELNMSSILTIQFKNTKIYLNGSTCYVEFPDGTQKNLYLD